MGQSPPRSLFSIYALFKVIVLFTIINPYRFTRQEMSDIFGLFEQTSDNIHLSSKKYEQGYLASVYVDLQSHCPPALVGESTHNKNNRYLFTWKFEHYLTHADGKQTSWRALSNYRAKPELLALGEDYISDECKDFDKFDCFQRRKQKRMVGSRLNRLEVAVSWD